MKSEPRLDTSGEQAADLSPAGWQARYDTHQTGWDRGGPSPMLTQWLTTGELAPCRILVPGCGRGHEVVALAEAGFDVTALDFADTAVKDLRFELNRRGLHASVIQSDIFAYCPDVAFDAVYEQTCLCAIHPDHWDRYQRLLRTWVRPGGKLHVLFMQSGREAGGPPFLCAIESMRELFSEADWQWPVHPHDAGIRVDHPAGMQELAYVLTRKEDD